MNTSFFSFFVFLTFLSISFQDSWLTNFSVSGTIPQGRANHQSIITSSQEMISFGGQIPTYYPTNEVLKYNLSNDTWLSVSPQGTLPSPRLQHTMIYNPLNNVLVAFGGLTINNVYFNDVIMYDISNDTWLNVMISGTKPTPLAGMEAVLTSDYCMLFFGGSDGTVCHTEMNKLDLTTNTWLNVTQNGPIPSGRELYSAILWQDFMILFGGIDTVGTYLNDILKYDTITDTWINVVISGPLPNVLAGCTGILVENTFMLIFGGTNSTGFFSSQVYKYNLFTDSWVTVSVTGSVPGRYVHTAVLAEGNIMVIYAGAEYSPVFGTDIQKYQIDSTTTASQQTTNQVTTSQQTTSFITTNRVTTSQQTTNQITTSQQTTNQITTSQQTTNQITTSQQTTNQVTTSQQTTNQVTTSQQTTNQVTTSQQTTNQVTTSQQTTSFITTNQVTTSQQTSFIIIDQLITTEERTTTASEITTIANNLDSITSGGTFSILSSSTSKNSVSSSSFLHNLYFNKVSFLVSLIYLFFF